jgi:hypothetical protein
VAAALQQVLKDLPAYALPIGTAKTACVLARLMDMRPDWDEKKEIKSAVSLSPLDKIERQKQEHRET